MNKFFVCLCVKVRPCRPARVVNICDQPFNSGGGGGAAAAPSAREGQGQHYKKIVKALRARTKKRDDAGAARATSSCTAGLQRPTGRLAGVPACLRSLKPLRSGHCNAQAYGRGKQRKRNDREKMYINAPRLQAQCRPCTPQCTPMQDPALPMRRECKRRL